MTPDREPEPRLDPEQDPALDDEEIRETPDRPPVPSEKTGGAVWFEIAGEPITTNAIYALLSGIMAGVVVGGLAASGEVEVAMGIVSILGGYAVFGHPLGRSLPKESHDYADRVAVRIIRQEPGFFLVPFAVLSVVGYVAATGTLPLPA